MDESHIRIFLSVDVAGSTRIKNILNHKRILRNYEDRYSFVQDLTTKGKLKNKSGEDLSSEGIRSLVLKTMISHVSEEDSDWAHLLENTFQDFDALFQSLFAARDSKYHELVMNHELSPWKALGDELIYSIKVRNRKEIFDLSTSFLAALRRIDHKLRDKNHIRLKGTAWVAGFPIRNRKVTMPLPALYMKVDGKEIPYPYPQTDFLGPDIDAGFRISKFAWPGFLTISVELAEFLGQYESQDQMRIIFIGWEKLKGVWQDRPYPIFWALLPEKYDHETDYTPYTHSDEKESDLIFNFVRNRGKLKEAKHYLSLIEEIRNDLPADLGVVKPYIFTELLQGESIPEMHNKILSLIRELSENPSGISGSQSAKDDRPNRSDLDDYIQKTIQRNFPE
jgi:hypothetical protein